MNEISHEKKQQEVGEMFSTIAHRYDLLNRLLSLGLDRSWRRRAIGLLNIDPGSNVLDIATGTADLAIEAARICTNCRIIGIDLSEQMLELGRKKLHRLKLTDKITLQSAAAENLSGFENSSFDFVTVAFGVRNFSNQEKGLSEVLRILKPGGRFMVLEFSMPKVPIIGNLYRFYFSKVLPAIAGLISDRSAYQYLPDSVEKFPAPGPFSDLLKTIGFTDVSATPFTFGTVTCYIASK